MSVSLIDALRAAAERLVELAKDDSELRDNVRQLALAVLEALPECEGEHNAATESAAADPPTPEEPELEVVPAAVAVETLWPAGANVSATSPAGGQDQTAARQQWTPPDDSDLALIESRCRLKAEGARWAATRRRRLEEGADFQYDIAPLDRDLIDRAREIENCYLWMNHSHAPVPEDLDLYDDVSASFETTADALALVRAALELGNKHPEFFEDSLDLLAEAQSALRTAVMRIDGPSDHDQQAVFNWLKYTAGKSQIYIQRYMRVDDSADPADNDSLSARIESLEEGLQQARKQEKNQRKLLKKIGYESKRYHDGGDDVQAHLNTLVGAVDELVSSGVPPSNSQLRELLLPTVDELPDTLDVTANVQLVFREIDRYLANLAPDDATRIPVEPIQEVQQVAELLSGKALFLIGGTRRPHSHEALTSAFGLSELIWFDTKEHEPLGKFEPHVARDDVAAVVLAIRWSSHSYGEVKEFCDLYEKPLVRLPAGYNPNQVAVQILEQAGERLRNR